jgi:hypothetical protein
MAVGFLLLFLAISVAFILLFRRALRDASVDSRGGTEGSVYDTKKEGNLWRLAIFPLLTTALLINGLATFHDLTIMSVVGAVLVWLILVAPFVIPILRLWRANRSR